MMHFHQKSTNHLSNSIKALLLLLITYSPTCYSSTLTPEEIAEAMEKVNLQEADRYCGKKLTAAMKYYCEPRVREAILREEDRAKGKRRDDTLMQKKSMYPADFDFDQLGADGTYEDDDMTRAHYRPTADDFFSNDIPFLFPSQDNRRRRRGIIDDCCRRACYKHELVKFCPIRG